MGYWVLKIIFGPIVRLIWVQRVAGLKNIPKNGPCIIAANHSSYFDFISLIAVCPRRIHFLAAEKFYQSKFWWPLVKLTGQIKVDRISHDKSAVYSSALSVLKNGEIIGIFPEGTRSPDGKIGRTFTGVARFALISRVPVVPVGIKGSYKVMSRFDKFPKLEKIIDIKIGGHMHFDGFFGKQDVEEVCREVTNRIVLEITKLST